MEYTTTQTLTLNKMKEYVQAYNVLEDAQIKFNKICDELEELNIKEFEECLELNKRTQDG